MFKAIASAAVKLSKPVRPTATNVNTGVTLTWDMVANAKAYQVYRKEDGASGETMREIGKTAATVFTDKTAIDGRRY